MSHFPGQYHDDLIQCPQNMGHALDMGHRTTCFLNLSFSVMIITAILGNIAVPYIVISIN